MADCDVIVNPANSFGIMGGGVAGAIKHAGGVEIEKEAVSKAPVKVGRAIVTTAGRLPCRYVIHAPTMKKPAMRISTRNVRLATRAAFIPANRLNVRCIAMPGMGTDVGGVSCQEAAGVIVEVAREFEDRFETILLIDRNKKMIDSFNNFL